MILLKESLCPSPSKRRAATFFFFYFFLPAFTPASFRALALFSAEAPAPLAACVALYFPKRSICAADLSGTECLSVPLNAAATVRWHRSESLVSRSSRQLAPEHVHASDKGTHSIHSITPSQL